MLHLVRENQRREPGVYQGELVRDHVCFLPTRTNEERRTGKIYGAFSSDIHRALDSWMLARALASPAQCLHRHGPRCYNVSYFCMMTCGLEKVGLVDQSCWEHDLFALLLRTLRAAGRRQQSKSIEVALGIL